MPLLRAFKTACRLFLLFALGYGVLLIVSIGSMHSSHGQGAIGDLVEAVVFFPQRFLPPPGQIPNEVHWLVCAVWVFSLLYIVSLVYSFIVPARPKDGKPPLNFWSSK